LSAAEAARRTGIDPSNLTKYERDAKGIKAETLDRILAGYEATLEELAAVLREVQGGPAVRWIVPGKLSEADLLLMKRIVLGDNGAPDEPKEKTPDVDPTDGDQPNGGEVDG
jgi:transcriptional regulator with XRE-family HTH domain